MLTLDTMTSYSIINNYYNQKLTRKGNYELNSTNDNLFEFWNANCYIWMGMENINYNKRKTFVSSLVSLL